MIVQKIILWAGRGRPPTDARRLRRAALVAVVTLAVTDGQVRADPATAPVGEVHVQPESPTLLRYDEDYASLADPANRSDPWDSLKYVSLGQPGWYATLGGETRQRFESYRHYPFDPGQQNGHGYDLQRYMGLADLHLGPAVRVFTEIKSALVAYKPVIAPIDRDALDLDQAFVDLKVVLGGAGGADSVTFRAGREELQYGSGRLIAVREGPNDRQSFDGGRVIVRDGGWQVDALLVRQVDDRPGVFDNQEVTGQYLYGLYATRPLAGPPTHPMVGVDLYALGYRQPKAAFNGQTGVEERYSLGNRWFGTAGGWDYDAEGIYQFGRFGPAGAIQAYYVGGIVGYTVGDAPLAPRVGFGADVASGDRGRGRAGLQTFDPMFSRGNYYDEASLLIYANVYALRPTLDLHPTKATDLTLDAVMLWRQSTGDGVYAPNVAPALGAAGGRAAGRFVGVQPTAQFVWQVDRHLTLTAAHSHLFDGHYTRSATPTGGGRAVDFAAAWLTYQF